MALDRRQFLRVLGTATGAATLTGLESCGWPVNAAPLYTAPPVGDDGLLRIPLAELPALAKVGAAYLVEAVGASEKIIVVHAREGEYFALTSTCPHAACSVGYTPERTLIECPCHFSAFALDGTVRRPPADRPLASFPIILDEASASLVVVLTAGDEGFPKIGDDGAITIDISKWEPLADVGGSMTYRPAGLGELIIVVRTGTSAFSVLSARCTHAGCTVAYDKGVKHLSCPCHESEFALDGKVLKAPALRPLRVYDTAFDETTQLLRILV